MEYLSFPVNPNESAVYPSLNCIGKTPIPTKFDLKGNYNLAQLKVGVVTCEFSRNFKR